MTTYQTEIQKPGAIRFGSAKIEWKSETATDFVNVGAIKGLSATTNSPGEQKFEPDNCPPIIIDSVPETWEWKCDVLECWNAEVLRAMFGDINTYTDGTDTTTIGVYAGVGKRPYGSLRITNTTAGEQQVVITLNKVKITSDFDFTFPTDKDGTTSITLPATWKAEIDGDNGFGTIVLPKLA